ncbi:MAG: hypothetical protein KC620_09090 [Myxococcales bacterium]|nr:hypothetical protein [Myxococcales bacterium]
MSDEQNPYVVYPDGGLDRRPRYYDGQFLKSADFIDEQRYHIDRHRRHVHAMVDAGVVAGLEVTGGTDVVTVAPGAAVDASGRQLVLLTTEQRLIAQADRGQVLTLFIRYAEAPADEAAAEQGTTGFTRFHEMPAIEYVREGTAFDGVVLARVVVDGAGAATADGTVRPRAGLRLPGPTPLTVHANEADPGRATINAALKVQVPAGTAHNETSPALDVIGHGRVTGALIVGQTGRTGYKDVTADANDVIVNGQLAAGGSGGSAIFKLGIGYEPPSGGEGTLISRTLGVGRTTVDAGYVMQVTGASKLEGTARVTGATALENRLDVAGYGAFAQGISVAGVLSAQGNVNVTGVLATSATVNVGRWLNVGESITATNHTTVGGNLTVGGQSNFSGGLNLNGVVLDLGAGAADRVSHAGKIGYQTFSGDSLDIVGAGTAYANRKVRLYAQGGTTSDGPIDVKNITATGLAVNGSATVSSNLAVTGNARVTGTATITGATTVTGALATDANLSVGGGLLDLGAGQANREINAGKIGYQTFSGDSLDVVGAGATRVTRKVRVFAEGGLRIEGTITANNGLDVADNGVFRKGLVIGQTETTGYQGVVQDGNDLVVNGQFAAGGSGGAAMFSLGVGTASPGNNEGRLLVGERLGIGTTSPGVPLHVNGNATVEGVLRVNNTLMVEEGTGNGIRWDNNIAGGSGDWAGLRYWVESGENTRFELGTGNDANDILVLKQNDSDVITLRSRRTGIGTSNPEALLHVNGDIKISSNDWAVRAPGDQVRVVWGKVKSDGTKWAGQGFTCWQYSVSGSAKTGVYQINFDVSFSSEPCVIATQHYPTDSNSSNSWGNTRDNAMVARVYNNWCQIVTGDGDGDRKWRSFHFIAIGPV